MNGGQRQSKRIYIYIFMNGVVYTCDICHSIVVKITFERTFLFKYTVRVKWVVCRVVPVWLCLLL